MLMYLINNGPSTVIYHKVNFANNIIQAKMWRKVDDVWDESPASKIEIECKELTKPTSKLLSREGTFASWKNAKFMELTFVNRPKFRGNRLSHFAKNKMICGNGKCEFHVFEYFEGLTFRKLHILRNLRE